LKKIRTILCLSLLLAVASAALGFSAPVAAQQTGLRMQADAAFEGHFKYGEWLPIRVELENNGADVNAEVQIRVTGNTGASTYALPVALPAGSRKQVTVYALPNNFSRELEARLVSGKELLASQRLTVQPEPNITYMVGLLSPERGALSFLSGIESSGPVRPKTILDLSLDELPERLEGLRSFDVLVFNNLDTSSLTTEQAAALENWVHQGGRLLVGGGAGAQKTAAGLPGDFLPMIPSNTQQVSQDDLAGLEHFAGAEAIRVPGPFLIAGGEESRGRTIVSGSDGWPLVQELSYGLGYVDFVALDLSGAPFDAWNGTADFWQNLLGPGASYPSGAPPDMSPRQIRAQQIPYALSNMPVLDLPSAQSLALLLGFYILLVGPVNYLVLRWQKRLHWAWITIPLVTVIFSAGAFLLGYTLRGSDLILNKLAVVELQPEGSASVTSFLGLFSPGQQAYEIELEGGGLVSPVSTYYDPWSGSPSGGGEMVFVQGASGQVRGVSVNQWSMQSFMTEDTWRDFGEVSASLQIEGNILKGTVENHSAYPIKDAVVVLGSQFAKLGDLAPGGSAAVELAFDQVSAQQFGPPISYMLFEEQFSSSGPSGPPREVELKRQMLDSYLQPGGMGFKGTEASANSGPYLLGWLDEAPPSVRISGREPIQQTTGLVYKTLSYQIPGDGPLSLPPGLIPGRIAQMPREGGTCGSPDSMAVYLFRGEAIFEFQLPDEAYRVPVETLKLSLSTDRGWWAAPETAIYNWQDENWIKLEGLAQGVNLIEDAVGLVSDSGLVQVRLGSEGQSEGCFGVALGLEAGLQGGVQE
jgi:hypothetical protein